MRYQVGEHTYELVEGWGTLPEGYEFFQVAGIAADCEDNIYLFTRSDHKVMVLDRDGNFVKAWDVEFSSAPWNDDRE